MADETDVSKEMERIEKNIRAGMQSTIGTSTSDEGNRRMARVACAAQLRCFAEAVECEGVVALDFTWKEGETPQVKFQPRHAVEYIRDVQCLFRDEDTGKKG